MAFKKSLQAIVLGLAIYGGSLGTLSATEKELPSLPSSRQAYNISSPDKKSEKFLRKSFFFDEFQFAPIERVYLDNKLKNFATNHASFHGTWFDFPLAFMIPTRLMGREDWWPEKLAWTWGVGNEAYAKSDGVKQVIWNLSTEARWYIDPWTFAGFGWQHHSFAGISCDCTEDFIKNNSIDTKEVNIRDILFLRYAHQLKNFDGKLSTEYFLTRNLWEAYLSDILSSEEKKHRAYGFPWAGGLKASVDAGNLIGFSLESRWEYSAKSFPNTFELSVNSFFSSEKERGASLFYRKTTGVGKNTIRVGYNGFEMDGTIVGIRMFSKSN